MVFGEIGTASNDMAAKQGVLERFTSGAVAKAMPHLRGVTWVRKRRCTHADAEPFNYQKGACFDIAGGCATGDVKSYFRSLK